MYKERNKAASLKSAIFQPSLEAGQRDGAQGGATKRMEERSLLQPSWFSVCNTGTLVFFVSVFWFKISTQN
jgi:hypothetical protein